MNTKLFNAFMFIAGAAIGSAVTWKYFKTKYERIAQEEIDSVKEVFSRNHSEKKHPCEEKETEDESETEDDNDIREYVDRIKGFGYSSGDSTIKEGKEDGPSMDSKPYVIPPEDFGDKDGYDCTSLNYYADGVLADDWDTPIKANDIDKLVGRDSLTHFGEYEDDSVFVRNDREKIDFEILRDSRNYYDVVGAAGPSEE